MTSFKANYKKIESIFLDEFSSIKLAITLLVFLAITTLIGTILPQEPMVTQSSILEKYSLEKYTLYKSLGLTDVFHSWWYLALLTTFGLNLTVASFRRVFPKWKVAFSWPSTISKESISKLPVTAELLNEKSLSIEDLEKAVIKKKYKTRIIDGQLIAVKGGWHRLGASVTHVGIMILLIGSTISILTGFNGMVQLSENEGFYIADLGQSANQVKSVEKDNWLAPISKMPIWIGKLPNILIRVNKTWREDYKTGEPKQWYSDLSVLDEDKKIINEKTIHVNDPLQFKGIDVYQSNWGRFADIGFNGERSTFPVKDIAGVELVFLPLSDNLGFKFEIQKPSVEKKSLEDIVKVYSVLIGEDVQQRYIGSIAANNSLQVGPVKVFYYGTKTLTGLQFKSNPGDLLIYPGVVLMMIGVLIAFGSKNQLWVTFKKDDNKILFGGMADRSIRGLTQELESIVMELSGANVNG